MLRVSYWQKPSPQRCYDWEVWDDNDCGCPQCHPIIGFGATEAEALQDYQQQLEEETP